MVPREGGARFEETHEEEVENAPSPRRTMRGAEPVASVRPLLVLAIVVAVAAPPLVHRLVQRRLVLHPLPARPRHPRPRRGGGTVRAGGAGIWAWESHDRRHQRFYWSGRNHQPAPERRLGGSCQ